MDAQTDLASQRLRWMLAKKELLQKINSWKTSVPHDAKSWSWLIVDGLLWGVGRVLGLNSSKLGILERERLDSLIQRCSASNNQDQQLHRAAMEIGALAPANDAESIAALSHLLDHEDKRVRVSAYRSIARIGGERATQVLRDALNNKRADVKQVAAEALVFCDASSVMEDIWDLAGREPVASADALPTPDPYSNPNELNWKAYQREERELVARFPGQFAAYHSAKRIALGLDEHQVYEKARKQVPYGLIMTVKIMPREERPIARFPSPWTVRPDLDHLEEEGDA